MQGFDIYFLGEMLPDTDPARVRDGVARLFKMAPEAADRLFTGKVLRVKQGVDPDTASRYRAAFRDAGALVQIVPEGAPPPTAQSTSNAPPSAAAPPGAASSGDDDTGGLTLAEPGAIIDTTPPPPATDIHIGDLEALPPNTGSLQDCHVDKPAQPIPDISHLKIIDE